MVARNCIGAGRRALPALALAVALFGLSAPAALAQPGAQSMNPVSATGIAFGPQTVFLGPVGQAAPTTLAATATQVAQTGTIESTPAIAATGTVQSIQAVSTGTAMLPANSATSMAPQVQTSAAGSAPQVTATSSATQQQQQQQQQTTSTSGIVPNGAPVQTIPPKTLVIYVTTTESIPSPTTTVAVMTSQLPDGSIITISGSGTSAADQVGGVPVKNLIIAGCVVGGAIIIGILGVYGYKFLRGGQRGTLEERKSKKGGWQRQAPRPRDEESPEGGTWDRDFAWNPVAMPTTPTLGKKPSSDSLYRAPPSASTPAYSGAPPSGPQPSWSMGTNGSSVSSANDLMAHLTHSINQGSNGFGGYPATEPSMAQISRGASNAELSALGFAPPAKASKPIPTAINTGKMARSSTAPQLNSANREEALRGTPMSIDVTGQVPGAGAPAQAPLPGTTSINTARAMSANYGSGSAANGGGRPKSLAVVHPGLKIEIPGRDGPKSTTEQNQRLARAQAGSVASVSRKPKAVGRSNTFSTSPTAQSDSAQMQARARDGTWAGRAQDMRASVYAEQGISRYGTDRIDRPVKAARPPKVLPVPSDPLLEMPPKRTASNKKLEGGVTWDAIVNVGEYGALRQPNGRPGGSSGGFA